MKQRLSAQLKHSISIISFSETKDSMGNSPRVESTFLNCRAGVWPLSAKETVENMRMGSEISHRIRIRYFSGITAKMVVRFGTRTFEIKGAINPGEANKVLDLVCYERS